MRLFSDSIDFVGCVYSRISFYDLRFLVAFWRTFLLLFVIVFRCIEVMRHKKSIFSSFFICWIFGGSLVGLWWVFGGSLVGVWWVALVGLWWVLGGGPKTHQRPTKNPAHDKLSKI